MKLNFKVDKDFSVGIERISRILDYTVAEDGIEVYAEKGDKIGASMKNGTATIYYRDKHHFFRELGVLVENLKKSDEFDIEEDSYFNMLGAMLDISRGATPTYESACRFIDYIAAMGYGMFMLYIEDVVKLESRKYFGYMRGRYTKEELSRIDDYAYEYGIEVIPSIECYGHMAKYLMWDEARNIKDTANVLLAREDATFEFVDELIGTVSSAFRTKRIHVGMDEAWDMGRGEFLTRHGYVHPVDIFNEYMDKLSEIVAKHSLTPMMWSDMYFRAENPANEYYNENIVISQKAKDSIPENMELVYWHYGEEHHCDEYMIEKHMDLGRKVIFAGGVWSWGGFLPEHNIAMDSFKFSIDACRKYGVRDVMTTIWFDDNSECPLFANLFGLSYEAEVVYDKNPTKEKLRQRFEAICDADYDAFYNMCQFDNVFDGEHEYQHFSERFVGKALFWQDILEGLYDRYLFEHPMSAHYAKYRDFMAEKKGGRWEYLYKHAYRLFDYLALKCEIAENLVPAYKSGDKEYLLRVKEELLPRLIEKTEAARLSHRDIWYSNLKTFGWLNLDTRYAGVKARCESAIYLIGEYLDGKRDAIDALEEDRLPKRLSPFSSYSAISTPNLKT